MKRLLQIFGLALALAWVPITSHCSWEGLVDGDLFKCAPAAETGDCSNDGDNCASVESASYKAPDAVPVVPTPCFTFVLFQLPALTTSAPGQVAPPTEAPSEVPISWRFACRTALPPRAPSFVS